MSTYLDKLRKETKAEVTKRAAELAQIRAFERTINPQARPRRKRKRQPRKLSLTGE